MTGRNPIRSEVICDQLVGNKAIFLQQLAHQFERRPLVPLVWTERRGLPLGIHGAATIDLEIDLIKMPDGVGL
jgi:hypothetical protein